MQKENTPQATLLPQHRAQLHASGLTDTTITTAGIYSMTDPARAARALNRQSGAGLVPALAFPYTAIDGAVVQTILRPDKPRVRADGSIAKYEQPAKEPHRIYFPSIVPKGNFLDPNIPLIFTEGIKKALAVAQAGGTVVSAQGVSVWHDAAHRGEHRGEVGEWKLRGDLGTVLLRGRAVYIAFDGNDTTSNSAVILAEARLARMLLDAGANVRLIRIPFQVGGPKVGIDDFLVTHTDARQALTKLMADAEAAKPTIRADVATKAAEPGEAVEKLLRDSSFVASLHVSDSIVTDMVVGKLRKTNVTRTTITKAIERFMASFVPTPEPGSAKPGAEPSDEPQATGQLLAELTAVFERYAVLPTGAAIVLALWVLHTWAIDAALFTPRIAVTSPTKGCGKSTVLDLLRALCRDAVMCANVTAAVLYRLVQAKKPTLLIDEADSFLHGRDDLRGVLNAGYEVNGHVLRCEGENYEPTIFRCFTPVAIACIGKLPPTLTDRSLAVSMERKPNGFEVTRRTREAREKLEAFKPRLLRWADDHTSELSSAVADTPAALSDRQRDICEPLLAIADHAGGDWPKRGRAAVVSLCRVAAADAPDFRERLLAAVWELFETAAFLTLKEIVARLLADETGGWEAACKGRPITTSTLSRWLEPFGVKASQPITNNPSRARGYLRADLEHVVTRYLAQATPAVGRVGVSPRTSATADGQCEPPTPQQHANTPEEEQSTMVEGEL